MRRGCEGEGAPSPPENWAASSMHNQAPHYCCRASPEDPVQGRGWGSFIPLHPLPNLITEKGRALPPNCGGAGFPGSPCETHLLPGKYKAELSKHATTCPTAVVLTQLPAWREGTSASPHADSQARISLMELPFCKSSPFFNLGKEKTKEQRILGC